jgi:hypothetical protein
MSTVVHAAANAKGVAICWLCFDRVQSGGCQLLMAAHVQTRARYEAKMQCMSAFSSLVHARVVLIGLIDCVAE